MMPPASGRPLRFFFLLMAGWIAVRIASQPAFPPAAAPVRLASAAIVQPPHAAHRPVVLTGPSDPMRVPQVKTAARWPDPSPRVRAKPGAALPATIDLLDFISFSVAFANRRHGNFATLGDTEMDNGRGVPPHPAPLSISVSKNDQTERWHGSAWMLWREASVATRDIASVGRLGGSQAGVRIDYDFTPAARSRTIAYVRATAALNRPASPEAAIGVAFQPARTVPVSIAAERRIALGSGGRNANAVMIVGGFGPSPVGDSPLLAEAYAQAGMVGFHRRDAFIDGKFSLLSPVGKTPLRIGGALSGGAQPGVTRIDIGPEVQFRLPLPQIATRISVEWRERIAGRAAPASGLAVTLAADF